MCRISSLPKREKCTGSLCLPLGDQAAGMRRSFVPYLQLALTIALITVSELFLKTGATAVPAHEGDWLGSTALRSPSVWVGAALLAGSSVTWILALRALPLYLAFTWCSVIHITIPLGAWLVLGESINPQRWAGIALVLAGVWVIAKPARKRECSFMAQGF